MAELVEAEQQKAGGERRHRHIESRRRRAAITMAALVEAEHPIARGQCRNPAVPEFAVLAEPVDQYDRLRLLPRRREVVDIIGKVRAVRQCYVFHCWLPGGRRVDCATLARHHAGWINFARSALWQQVGARRKKPVLSPTERMVTC